MVITETARVNLLHECFRPFLKSIEDSLRDVKSLLIIMCSISKVTKNKALLCTFVCASDVLILAGELVGTLFVKCPQLNIGIIPTTSPRKGPDTLHALKTPITTRMYMYNTRSEQTWHYGALKHCASILYWNILDTPTLCHFSSRVYE